MKKKKEIIKVMKILLKKQLSIASLSKLLSSYAKLYKFDL